MVHKQDVEGLPQALIEISKEASAKTGVALRNEVIEPPPDPITDKKYGFSRDEMGKQKLLGTVKYYDAHVFLIWGSPTLWPKNMEDIEESLLPGAVIKAVGARKKQFSQKVKVNVAGAVEGDEDGSILVFPHEIAVKGESEKTV